MELHETTWNCMKFQGSKPDISATLFKLSEHFIKFSTLREICPCGFCKAKRLRHQAVVDAHTVQVTAMFDQGYGAQICFSDGHDQGIFPWVFLKNLDL